jgi:hypothetical protein
MEVDAATLESLHQALERLPAPQDGYWYGLDRRPGAAKP